MTSSLRRLIHVAVVLDGDGARPSVRDVRRLADAAPPLGVGALTIVLLSADAAAPPRAPAGGVPVRFADYSRRRALAAARARLAGRSVARDDLARGLADVDLVVRTGGGRVRDFVLWECGRAEFVFTPTRWRDFDGDAFAACVEEFRRRRRGCVDLAAVLA